jgi:hypothetical protein
MNRVNTEAENPQAAAGWILWTAGGLAVSIGSVAFLLWGVNGPTYISDLMAAYCG